MKILKSIRMQLILIVLLCYLVPTLLLGQYMGGVFFADLRQKTETAAMSAAKTVAEQLETKKSELRANAETKGTDAIKLIVERIVNG